jgi:obg-like ATPase 1
MPVPDQRFDWLCDMYKPKSVVPAFLTCIDIAGLTAGASTGAGLGNSFLSHVRAVDGIFQVVRAFDDAEVIHVEGDVNPIRDMEIIQNELRLKDIDWVEKTLVQKAKLARIAGGTSLADKAKKEEAVRTLSLSVVEGAYALTEAWPLTPGFFVVAGHRREGPQVHFGGEDGRPQRHVVDQGD